MTSEWTSVQPRKPRRGGRPPTASRGIPAVSTITPGSNTAAEIKKAHETYKEAYLLSDVHKAMGGILPKSLRVTKAVCLGVGSFDMAGGWAASRKAHMQVLAFLDLVGELGEVDCFFQEPAFTVADGEFLGSLGYKVVKSPEGFDLVDGETLVFGVHLYAPIYDMAMEKALPRVFVGTGWEAWDDVRLSSTTKKPQRILEMHKVARMTEFPQDDSYTFSSTVVYWRTEDSEKGVLESQEGDSTGTESGPTEPEPPTQEDPIEEKLKNLKITQ